MGPVLVPGPGDICHHGPGGGWMWIQLQEAGLAAAALQNQGKCWGPCLGEGR